MGVMATADWLGSPPFDNSFALVRWALARMAACAVDDVACRATVRRTRFGEENLGGRFGSKVISPARVSPAAPESDRIIVEGTPGTPWREDLGDGALRALFDPVVLIRDIGAVSASPGVRLGRPCVELDVRPHPVWADPESPWCPPGARLARLAVDAATGFLIDAQLMSPSRVVAHYEIAELDAPRLRGDATPWSGDWHGSIPAGAVDRAGWALARMAATLREPAVLAAEVEILVDAREHAFAPVPPAVTDRVWTAGVTIPGGGVTWPGGAGHVLTMGDDYVPEDVPFPIARLAEMLTPARIVSHLERVSAVSSPGGGRPQVHVTASVRPDRTFPFSAWAPDETVRCTFGVDQATGVLLDAETHVVGGSVLAHYRVGQVTPPG